MLFENAQSGGPRLVTIVGHAGIGKSRLAREVIAHASQTARVVKARCPRLRRRHHVLAATRHRRSAAEIRADDTPEEARGKLAHLIRDDDVAARIASAIGLSDGTFALHEDELGGAQVPREARGRWPRSSP
jgi:predicted ATPase